MTIWAKIRTRFEGVHCWPAAYGTVDFLQHPHRHEFHVVVQVQQFHTDRDVEYIMLKRHLDDRLRAHFFPLSASCELMAQTILQWVEESVHDAQDPKRRIIVEVNEDGENGAVVES